MCWWWNRSETKYKKKRFHRLEKNAVLSRLNWIYQNKVNEICWSVIFKHIMCLRFWSLLCQKSYALEMETIRIDKPAPEKSVNYLHSSSTSTSFATHNNCVQDTFSMEESITATKLEKTQGRKKTRRRGPRLTGVSRQRRMANARERSRVQNLNAHIERLRDLIPLFPGEKKPSKTETIRLAAVYISCLTDILEAAPEGLGRISSDDLMPTFPELEDSFSLASGIPPTLSLPKFLFEPLCDEDNLLDLDLGEFIWEEYEWHEMRLSYPQPSNVDQRPAQF